MEAEAQAATGESAEVGAAGDETSTVAVETPEPDGDIDPRLRTARDDAAKYRTRARDTKTENDALKEEIEELKSGKKVSEQDRLVKEANKRAEAAEARTELTATVAGLAASKAVPLDWVMAHIEDEGIDATDQGAIKDAVQEAADDFATQMAQYGYVKAEKAAEPKPQEAASTEEAKAEAPVKQPSQMDITGTVAPAGNITAMISELNQMWEQVKQAMQGGNNKAMANAQGLLDGTRMKIQAMPNGVEAVRQWEAQRAD